MRKFRALFLCLAAVSLSTAIAAQTPSPTPTPTPTATATPPTPTPTATPSVSVTPSATPTPTATPMPFTTPSGQTWTTQDSRAVSGARLARAADDTTWFMTPANDRISKLQNGLMTQWQIRPNEQIGANPVDFVVEGDQIWFIENGQSQIIAGSGVVAQLDTSTGALREWIFPASRPSGFYRAPDGKIWVAQSAGVLESLDTTTLEVTDYRAAPTAAFAGAMAVGPDNAIYIGDFGSNRVIRHDLADNTEKAWTLFDPSLFVLNISDMKFDEDGFLWITELTGNRLDRFDPATGELRSYIGFLSPIHFDFDGGNIYVSERTGTQGRVVIVDPRIAPYTLQTLTATDLTVGTVQRDGTNCPTSARCPAGKTRDTTITSTTFTPEVATFAGSDLTVTQAAPGLLRIQFNKTNAWGITSQGGAIWVGSDQNLVRLVAQTIGGAGDLTAAVALQRGTFPADSVAVNLILSNRGTAPVAGTALFQYSAGAFPRPRVFFVAPGQTAVVPDAFLGAASAGALVLGGVRIQITNGQAADLIATVRTSRSVFGGTSGFALPAQPQAATLQAGATRTLFLGARPNDLSTFGCFSSSGGEGVLQLVAADGTLRGTRSLSLVSNVLEFHNPAASFFGVAAQPGDVIRISVSSGSLQPFVLVQDVGTRDIASIPPAAAGTDAVFPNLVSRTQGPAFFVSGLFLSNPDTSRAVNVSATYYPIGGAPIAATVALPPGASIAFDDALTDFFHAPPGEGAVVLTGDAPFASAIRNAARDPSNGNQYAGGAGPAAVVPSGGATAFGALSTGLRRTDLLVFNRGAAGTLTVVGFDGDGEQAGQVSVPLPPSGSARLEDALLATGVDTTFGKLRLLPSAGMQVYVQSMTADLPTGDTDVGDPH